MSDPKLSPDPSRNWFLYFNDKEMGPLSENEVKKMLISGELSESAFAFTEGMTDWAAIADISILKKAEFDSEPQQTKSIKIEPITGSHDISKVKESKAPTQMTEQKIAPLASKSTGASIAPASEPKKSKKSLRVLIYLLAIILVGAIAYEYGVKEMLGLNEAPVSYSPRSKKRTPPSPSPSTSSEENSTPPAEALTQNEPQKNTGRAAFDWSPLLAQRDAVDPNSPPFRLSEFPLGESRPILVGALSKALGKTGIIHVALFPSPEDSAQASPRYWIFSAPVLDSFFSIGPLSVDSDPLANGTYTMMAYYGGKYLGEISFKVSSNHPAADLRQKQLSALGEQEKSALTQSLEEAKTAYSQLESMSNIAIKGPPAYKVWQKDSLDWKRRLDLALNEQDLRSKSPALYPDAQTKLLSFLRELKEAHGSFEVMAKSGPKTLMKVKGVGPGQILTKLKNEREALVGEIQISIQSPPNGLKIDIEAIKARLSEMKP